MEVTGSHDVSAEWADHEAEPGRGWWHFHHGADIGVCGRGDTPAQAFEQAGVALTAVITEPGQVSGDRVVEIHCEAPDLELLFVDWLNSLIFEMVTRNLLFARFEVEISDSQLRGRAWGEPVDVPRHQPAVEIKGATYTALSVTRAAGGWRACCVVDV